MRTRIATTTLILTAYVFSGLAVCAAAAKTPDNPPLPQVAAPNAQAALPRVRLIATGGTAFAAVKLIERLGAKVAGASFVVDLPDLGGLEKLRALGLRADALCAFEGH